MMMATSESAGGQNENNFKEHAALLAGIPFEARVIGAIRTGIQQKDVWANGAKTGEVVDEPQIEIYFQLVDEDTLVDNSPDDKPGSVPLQRRMPIKRRIKWSSSEKANLFKDCKKINPKSIKQVKNPKTNRMEDAVDLSEILGCACTVTMRHSDNGSAWFDSVAGVSSKVAKMTEPLEGNTFLYCPYSGAHAGTSIEDVPEWIFRTRVVDAVDAEVMEQIDAISEYIAKVKFDKENKKKENNGAGSSLAGDDKADSPKVDALTAEQEAGLKEAAEAVVTEEVVVEEAPAVKPAPKTRTRTRTPAAKGNSELDAKIVAAKGDPSDLQVLFAELGGADSIMDDIYDNITKESEEEEAELIIVAIRNL